MTVLPKKSHYKGYDITNSGIVVRIWLKDLMVEYGAMSQEQAHAWIDKNPAPK